MNTVKQSTPVKTAETAVDKPTLIKDILPQMLLAASSHNTQPWVFAVKNGHIDVYPNWNRHLFVSDPTTRQTYVSLGCAITNGLVAAAHHGFTTNLSYLPDGVGENKVAARLTFTSGDADAHLASLFSSIKQRHTDRTIYDGQPLTPESRNTLISSQSNYVALIEDQPSKEKLADLTAQATKDTLSRKDFKGELSHWIRNNWTSKPDGMPGFASGIPGPVSLVAPMMVKIAPIHKQESPKSHRQIMSSSAVAIIATPTDEIPDWMRAGQLLEQIWLEATKAGLSAMPIICAVESSDNTRSQLKQTLRAGLIPQSVIRIGHGTYNQNFRPTPRRSVEDCLIN